ncbi:hypothetical protein [Lentzea flaviverrucosa]|uniref:Uncharacterized protein n=1 Tax=Lentzea flaviverrucosa TaxID=200379 RepID=A0A1H9RE83_9PSEU|nr:hypothetical protein [Lentzea flaviverrucosa]RDI32952.1 hypothetical protein DFR72_102200 [Lentzea flaviverrucosa]SER70263.1 hypothetical protein SAMN05216195_106201 [Lentzea flaviverrucosa]
MTTTTNTTAHPSKSVLVAAWAAPVMVIGQFGLLSGIPIAVVLVASLRDRRSRVLRWWTGALTLAYAIPLTMWLAGPSEAPSLSKYMSPATTAALAATGVVVAIAHQVVRRRSTDK